MLFGINIGERLVAEFRCFLASGGSEAPAAATMRATPSPTAFARQRGGGGTPSTSGDGRAPATPAAAVAVGGGGGGIDGQECNVQGRLYLTQHCLCYTTMLDDDAKGCSDTTVVLLRSHVREPGI